jgi:tetratricopeptide (TPR) repeat protein
VLTVSAGKSEQGTETLLTFAAKNAGSALGEKALLNAFMAARDQQDLTQLVRIGDQLLRDYPKSQDLASVLGTLGKMTAQAAQFEEAARYLNEAARREPGARGQELLRTAVVLHAGRGDRRAAEDAYRLMSGAAPALTQDAIAALGELYRRSGDGAALAELARSPQAPAELRFESVQRALAAGATLDKVAPDLRALASTNNESGAKARLLLLELSRQQVEAISFGDKRAEDAKVIARRFAAQNQIESQYLALVKQAPPSVVVSALGRLATLYQSGAQFLADAPVPDGLNPEQSQRYKDAFRSKSQPLLKKAEDALRTCGETAQRLHVFTAAAKACTGDKAPPLVDPLPSAVAPRPSQPEAPALRARLLKNPSDGDALVQLALLHQKAGDSYGAKLAADRAVEVAGPALSAAHNIAAVLAYQLGEPDEAYRHLQDALKADKRNPRARLSLANLYKEYGYSKLIVSELGGLSESADLARDPAVLSGPAASPPAGDAPVAPTPEKKP